MQTIRFDESSLLPEPNEKNIFYQANITQTNRIWTKKKRS